MTPEQWVDLMVLSATFVVFGRVAWGYAQRRGRK